jgi:hypothetical protein
MRRRVAAGLGVGLALGCGRPAGPPFHPIADVKLLMATVIEPAADVYWDAVKWVTDEHGTTAYSPKSPEEWAQVRTSAYVLAESGNLLMMDGRARDGGNWMTFARAMVDAGRTAALAAEKQDTSLVFDAGAQVYETCTRCHSVYAIPLARPADTAK